MDAIRFVSGVRRLVRRDVSLRRQVMAAAVAVVVLGVLGLLMAAGGWPWWFLLLPLAAMAAVLAVAVRMVHRMLEQLGYLSAAAALQRAEIPVHLRIRGVAELNRAVDAFATIAESLEGARRQVDVLREAVVRFGMIVESADCGIVTTDAAGIVTFWNPAAEDLLGHRAPDALGRPLETLLDRSSNGVLERLSVGGGSRALSEVVRERRDGSSLVLGISETPILDGRQHLVGSLLMISDVTELRAGELRLQERQRDLTRQVVQLERRNREVLTISRLTELLQACSQPDEAHALVVQFAGELFPGATGDLLIVNNSRDAVEAVASWGAAHAQPAPFPPGHCWALRRGIRHTVARGTASAQCQHLTGTQPALYACVPLAANGELLGVLHLRTDQPNEENTLLDLAGRFSEAVALALANLRLRETLRWQSIRDPLTGLFNRRYLEASFEREVKRSDRQGRPIGVIMLDLDHFKHFNDANGHDDGDAFLRELGNLLGTSVRADDIACRFGGEEFILVLPEAPLEATRRRAEELREAIARLRVQHRGRQLPTVTASLGVAVFPDHGANVGELIRAADDALYQAKSGGRNRLAIAPLDDEDDGARPVRLLRAS